MKALIIAGILRTKVESIDKMSSYRIDAVQMTKLIKESGGSWGAQF